MPSSNLVARRFLVLAFVVAGALLSPGSDGLFAEDRPFRKWDKPLPQDIEFRLVHWTNRSIFLESTTRRYYSLRWSDLSFPDQAYVRQGPGEGDEPSPIDPALAKDPIPLFYPNGTYASPRIPVAFNGRYVICADPDGKTLYSSVHAAREFRLDTQQELIKRFAGRLSLGETLFAAGPFNESIWIADEKRSLKEIAPDIDSEFVKYPEDTYFVGTDGSILIFETRLEGTAKDSAEFPQYNWVYWADSSTKVREPLLRYVHLGFATHAKLSPDSVSKSLQEIHRRAGRGEMGPLGELREWKQTRLRYEDETTRGRLVVRNSRQAVILLEDRRLQIVSYPTAEDAKYLTEVEGFWSSRDDASRDVRYVATTVPAFSRDLERIFREYDGDVSLIGDLEEALEPDPKMPPDDRNDDREAKLNRLANCLLDCDVRFAERETERLKKAVAARKMSNVEAGKRFVELQSRRVDPTNGDTPAEKLIADWKRLRPESPHPALVAGIAAHNLAWKHRGSGFAYTVDGKQFEGFGLFLDKSEGEFDEAEAKAPDDPVLAYWQLEIGRGLGYPREKMDAIVQRSVAADPGYASVHGSMGFYLTPRWHGAPGDIGKYAASVVKRLPGPHGAMAFLYVYQNVLPTDPDIISRDEFDRDTLRTVGRELARSSEPGDDHWLYAEVLAFYAKDDELAKELIEKAEGVDELSVKSLDGNRRFPEGGGADAARQYFAMIARGEGTPRAADAVDDSIAQIPLEVTQPVAKLEMVSLGRGSRTLTLVSEKQAVIVDLQAGEVVGKFGLRGARLDRLHASQDGETVVVSGTMSNDEYFVARVDVDDSKELVRMKNVVHPARGSKETLSPDGKFFAKSIPGKGFEGKSLLQVWNVATGEKLAEIDSSPFSMSEFIFAPDGSQVFGWTGTNLGIFDVATQTFRTVAPKDRFILGDARIAPTGEIVMFAYEEPRKPLAERGTESDRILVMKSPAEAATAKMRPWPEGTGAVTSGNKYVVSANCRRIFAAPQSPSNTPIVDVFDVATGRKTHRLSGSGGNIRALLLATDERLVTVTTDGTLRVWDVSDEGLESVAKRRPEAEPPTPEPAAN